MFLVCVYGGCVCLVCVGCLWVFVCVCGCVLGGCVCCACVCVLCGLYGERGLGVCVCVWGVCVCGVGVRVCVVCVWVVRVVC